jgi:glycogen debranching enzyme
VLAPDGWSYASALPVDVDDPGRFNALFGRDSLITSLQLLEVRPDVARSTLRVLATLQGRDEHPLTDEEPGKIVHEYRPEPDARFEASDWSSLIRDGQLRYYGSADSTPWFLVVLASLGDAALVGELKDSWRAAGSWLERALERGGGLVRYGPRTVPGGLVHQGWRDTVDPRDPSGHGGGILHEDGTAPTPPIADADTQAVALAGLRALAVLRGDSGTGEAANALAARIEEHFGPETMAVERGGREVKGAGSQLGWLLWADALSPAAAARAADRLCEEDVLTPFGLRTLSALHPRFAPDAYHRGAVWPFDSWIGWGGLRAAGREEEAERVRWGVLEALDRLRMAPELYAVTEAGPERVPIANQVQAWTVGARWALENHWDGRRLPGGV